LAEAGEVAALALHKALAAMPSPEARIRIMRLLAQVETPTPPRGRLRDLRGVSVLERKDTTEARLLLEALAKGSPQASLTREARAALERLAKRPLPGP
jgi:hypothetical protein